MNSKTIIYFFLTVGSIAGGWAPTLWGAGTFSLQGLGGSVVGGLLGIWAGYKFSQLLGV